MIGAIASALLSHWRRNPLQLVTLLAGLALGTALWSGVQAINAEARASYSEAAAALDEARLTRITARPGQVLRLADYVALRRAGFNVSPVVEGKLGPVRLIGIEPLTVPQGIGPERTQGGVDPATFLGAPGQILARAQTLADLPDTGASLVASPKIAPGTAYADIGLAQRLLNRGDRIDFLLLAPQHSRTVPALETLAPGLVQTPPPDEGADLTRLTDSFHLNLTAFGLLSFAVGLFIVHGAIGLAFEQRRPMVRTLRALGVPLRLLIGAMAAELLVLALVAGCGGVALGYGMAAALLPDVAASLRGLYGAEVSGQLSLRLAWWLSGLAMALAGTAAAGAGALWSLARMPLLASAQPRAWALAQDGRGQGLAALALLGLAGGLALWGHGLMVGFGMLGALLIGGALLLPPLLGALLRGAEGRARGPVHEWFWADTRQQLPGLSLALMALLLAMAANIGVSTMVSSFRLTFTGFLDQRLASELYVTAADPAQAQAIADVARTSARTILPILTTETTLAGQPVILQGMRDDATYRDTWTFLDAMPQVWDRLARGEGVLINEQFFRRTGLGLGAAVTLASGRSLPVLAVAGDYGNPRGQVIVTEALFHDLAPQVTALRFGLRVAPDQVANLRAALQKAGVPAEAMLDQAALKALSMAVFERTFAVTAALNVLTLGVAGFAMLMSLLTLAAMRLPQLAPVWALGLTRRRLALLDLARAVMLAALTGALALPLGLALAAALLWVVNVEAFGWRLPMYLFPLDYLRLNLLALMAATLAALWPALRLARAKPAQLLGVFRHER